MFNKLCSILFGVTCLVLSGFLSILIFNLDIAAWPKAMQLAIAILGAGTAGCIVVLLLLYAALNPMEAPKNLNDPWDKEM